ncbi:GID complex subunit 4, VID24 [Coemansia umbellata]|nr:GID complex subunit 4, VID24 [Coemansia umbellata]
MARSPATAKEYVEHKPGSQERRSSVRSIAFSFEGAEKTSNSHQMPLSPASSSTPSSPHTAFSYGQTKPRPVPGVPAAVSAKHNSACRISVSPDGSFSSVQTMVELARDHSRLPSISCVEAQMDIALEAAITAMDSAASRALVVDEKQNNGLAAIQKIPGYALSDGNPSGESFYMQQQLLQQISRPEIPCSMDTTSCSLEECNDSSSECSDEEDMRSEPLPTPEQLILSQSWSTWPTPCHHLYSGSKFSGSQSNGTRSYMVTVTLKYVDMGVPELCGHFTIRGLTNELPKLTTYFDAQVVGAGNNSFITNQWDATVDTDRTHWSFFPAFKQYRNKFDCKDFLFKLNMSDRFIFMRWKERFVVPNYKLSRINGASYDGFYYVCYDQEEETIVGYYYHRDSDHYQCLKLTHIKQTSFSHFELA